VADAEGRSGSPGTDAVSQQPGGDPHRDEELVLRSEATSQSSK